MLKANLDPAQRVADIQRETAALLQDMMPDVAAILVSGADTIEAGLDCA